MSQEKVELIRRAHDALNRSDVEWSEIQRLASELLHPDIEWHDQRELPGATIHRGVEGVERHVAAARETLDYQPADLLELIDAEPHVVAVYRVHAQGKASGVPVERDACYVYSFRSALIDRVQIFGTKSEALEAAGLSSRAMSQDNVELVRRYLESLVALMDRAEDPAGRDILKLPDFPSHMEEYWHPEVVFDVSGRPDGGIYHGRDGVIQASLDWLQAWEEYTMDFKEILPAGDRVVLVHLHIRGKGKSGPQVEQRDLYVALTIGNGQFIHYEEYPTRAKALEAVGLSEQDAHAGS